METMTTSPRARGGARWRPTTVQCACIVHAPQLCITRTRGRSHASCGSCVRDHGDITQYCKCQGCDLCREKCMSWCTSEMDCHSKACSGCDLCKNHVHNKKCEPWCTKANCRQEACLGCDVCDELGDKVACHSGHANDVETEECAGWCNQEHSSEHCRLCACKSCMFCEKAGGIVRETGKPCPPSTTEDADTMRCEAFCRESHLDEHCDLCKCKACPFCPMRHDTLLKCPLPPPVDASTDSPTIRCEPFCAMAHATSHCALCKCAGCSFCVSDMETAGDASRNPLTGLNVSQQLSRIINAAGMRVAASKPPPPPRTVLPPPPTRVTKPAAASIDQRGEVPASEDDAFEIVADEAATARADMSDFASFMAASSVADSPPPPQFAARAQGHTDSVNSAAAAAQAQALMMQQLQQQMDTRAVVGSPPPPHPGPPPAPPREDVSAAAALAAAAGGVAGSATGAAASVVRLDAIVNVDTSKSSQSDAAAAATADARSSGMIPLASVLAAAVVVALAGFTTLRRFNNAVTMQQGGKHRRLPTTEMDDEDDGDDEEREPPTRAKEQDAASVPCTKPAARGTEAPRSCKAPTGAAKPPSQPASESVPMLPAPPKASKRSPPRGPAPVAPPKSSMAKWVDDDRPAVAPARRPMGASRGVATADLD